MVAIEDEGRTEAHEVSIAIEPFVLIPFVPFVSIVLFILLIPFVPFYFFCFIVPFIPFVHFIPFICVVFQKMSMATLPILLSFWRKNGLRKTNVEKENPMWYCVLSSHV